MIEQAVQTLVDAVSVGGLYALTALGIGLIFGVMRLINFAHAQLIMIAGYAVLLLFTQSAALAIVGRARRAPCCSRCSSSARPSGRCAAPIRRRC